MGERRFEMSADALRTRRGDKVILRCYDYNGVRPIRRRGGVTGCACITCHSRPGTALRWSCRPRRQTVLAAADARTGCRRQLGTAERSSNAIAGTPARSSGYGGRCRRRIADHWHRLIVGLVGFSTHPPTAIQLQRLSFGVDAFSSAKRLKLSASSWVQPHELPHRFQAIIIRQP